MSRTRAIGLGTAMIMVAGVTLVDGCSWPRRERPLPPPETLAVTDIPQFVRAAVESEDRSREDKALDEGRQPARLLTFFGIRPGMRVAELGAGTGYTTELLARVVGEAGAVFAQNPSFVLERFAEIPWSQRLLQPAMEPVIRVDREFDDPLPPEARSLDAVINVLFYHDTVWLGADRAAMNARVFEALKRGGVYGIVDHSAAAGTGTEHVRSLHRIDEEVVRREIEAAGFRLVADADFLRNRDDKRDWNAAPRAAGDRRGTSDRFVLLFARP